MSKHRVDCFPGDVQKHEGRVGSRNKVVFGFNSIKTHVLTVKQNSAQHLFKSRLSYAPNDVTQMLSSYWLKVTTTGFLINLLSRLCVKQGNRNRFVCVINNKFNIRINNKYVVLIIKNKRIYLKSMRGTPPPCRKWYIPWVRHILHHHIFPPISTSSLTLYSSTTSNTTSTVHSCQIPFIQFNIMTNTLS